MNANFRRSNTGGSRRDATLLVPGLVTLTLASLLAPTRAGAQIASNTGPSLPPVSGSMSVVVSESFNGSVVRVADDRTLVVHRDDKDRDETVYLYGVKAAMVTADGKPAQDYLTDHLKNAKVRIEGRSRDKAGNLIAMVTLVPPTVPRYQQSPDASGLGNSVSYRPITPPVAPQQSQKTINETVLNLGLARYDAGQAPNEKSLADAQADAQKGKKGVWSEATVSSAEKAAER